MRTSGASIPFWPAGNVWSTFEKLLSGSAAPCEGITTNIGAPISTPVDFGGVTWIDDNVSTEPWNLATKLIDVPEIPLTTLESETVLLPGCRSNTGVDGNVMAVTPCDSAVSHCSTCVRSGSTRFGPSCWPLVRRMLWSAVATTMPGNFVIEA